MKIKENFKDLKKPDDINREELQSYLKELYGDDDYEGKDASYVEDREPELVAEYKQRTNLLLNELIRISDNHKFEQLRPALTDDVLPGKMRDITDELKKTAEIICYRAENNLVNSPEKFKAEIRSATIDACAPGALTNMQIIVSSMDDSFYNSKYEYIKNLAIEYVRAHKLSDRSGNEVHKANELIHEVSHEYNVYPPKDVHAIYRDLSSPPSDNFVINAKFKDYLNDVLNTREGIHGLVEVVSNNYLSRLPHSPETGMFPAKEGDDNSAALEQISSIASSVGVTLDDIIEYNDDYTEFKYIDNYQDAIQAATMNILSQEGLIDQQALEYTEVTLMAAHSKIVRDADNKPVMENIPSHNIERKVTVIEAPNAWYATSQQNGCLTIEEKLFSSMKLKNLTINGQSLEDYLHDKLADKMEFGLKNALRIVIETNDDRIALEQPDIIKELTLLSDQVKDLKKYLTKEELSLLSNDDLNKWIDFSNSPDKLRFIAKIGTGLMLEKHLEGENTTFQEFMKARERSSFLGYASDNLNIELISYIIPKVPFDDMKWTLYTALEQASKNGKVDAIAKLVELGADIKATYNYRMTALHHAAKNGKVDAIAKLVELGADIKATDYSGMTALHHAAQNGNLDAIVKLVELGADINATDNFGMTALHYVDLLKKPIAIVKLVELGADIKATDNSRRTALHHAAQNGKVDAIAKLVELGADIKAADKSGMTALHHAAQNGKIEAINKLIELGVNVDPKDENLIDALLSAAVKEEVEVIEKMVNLGVDINAKDDMGNTALYYAAAWGKTKSIIKLKELNADLNIKNENGKTAFHKLMVGHSSAESRIEISELLIKSGLDLKDRAGNGRTVIQYMIDKGILPDLIKKLRIKDADGLTPLDHAAKHGEVKVIESLVELNVHKSAYKDERLSALNYAVENGQIGAIDTLIEFRSIGDSLYINLKDKNLIDALCTAAAQEKIEVIEKMVKLGVDVNTKNNKGLTLIEFMENQRTPILQILKDRLGIKYADGLTPLHHAAGNGQIEVIENLVRLRLDINTESNQGLTALKYAVSQEKVKAIEKLVELGANINQKNKYGTALHYAVEHQKIESIEKLLELGADISIENNKGETALEALSPKTQNELVVNLAKTDKHKLPKIIANLAQQAKDDPKAWDLIDETMAKVNLKDRPIVIIRTLKQINNASDKEKLLNHLPKNRELPTLWQSIVRKTELIYGNSSIDPQERKDNLNKRINRANNTSRSR